MDLVVVVPDQGIRATLEQLLHRHHSIGMRPIEFRILEHIGRDPGCLRSGHDLLRIFVNQSAHGLVVFDRMGCGKEELNRAELELEVEQCLGDTGWAGRSAAVVIDPELETWVWSPSPQVDQVLGWSDRQPALRTWLREFGLLEEGAVKPSDPKTAYLRALRQVNKHHSSAVFADLAQAVGFATCSDLAFRKLRDKLREWFPPH